MDRTPNFAAGIQKMKPKPGLVDGWIDILKPVPYCVLQGVSEVQVFAPLMVKNVVDEDADEDYHGVYCHSDSVGVNYAGRKVGGRLDIYLGDGYHHVAHWVEYLNGASHHVRD